MECCIPLKTNEKKAAKMCVTTRMKEEEDEQRCMCRMHASGIRIARYKRKK